MPRSVVRASAVGAAAAFVLFLLLLTYGRPWQLVPKETLGNFYDAQADAFRHGRMDVDPAEVTFEGFLIRGRTYEYQGPVPALMRLPIVLVTDRLHGRLTRLSMLAAYAVALWFLVRLQVTARRVVRGDRPAGPGEAVWSGLVTFGLGASSLLFLASKAWVYHEALLWGVAFSLGSLWHLAAWLTGESRPALSGGSSALVRPALSPRVTGAAEAIAADEADLPWWGDRHAVLAGVFGGLALLTRSAVGAGPMAALLIAAAVQALVLALGARRPALADRIVTLAGWRRAGRAGLAALVLGVVVPVGLYVAVNEAKFGTALSLPADKQVLVKYDPARQAFFASNGNSLFGLRYVPSVAFQAFRPDAVSVSGEAAFVAFPRTRPKALGGTLFAERDWSSSVTSCMPLVLLLALLGLLGLVAPKRAGPRGDVASLRIPFAGAVAGGLGFFAIGYMANRYMNDLFPALAIGAAIGLQVLAARLLDRPEVASDQGDGGLLRRTVTVVLALLAVWGAWANVGLGIEYQRVIAPGTRAALRADWIVWQSRLGTTPAAVRVDLLAPLPARPGLGAVAVVGRCDAVYRSNGSIWIPVEGGPRAGRFTGTMRLDRVPDRPVTVVEGRAGADADRLVLEPVGDGKVRLVATVTRNGHETRSLPGPAVVLEAGTPYPVDITFDWRAGYAEVLLDGRELLASNIALRPAVMGISPGFAPQLDAPPVATPACDALLG